MKLTSKKWFFLQALMCFFLLLSIQAGVDESVSSENQESNQFVWTNKLKIEGSFSKNVSLLNNGNGNLDKTIVPGKFNFNSDIFFDFYDIACQRSLVKIKANVGFRGVFGAPEASIRTSSSSIKDLEAVIGSHAHPMTLHVPILREIYLDISLNDFFALGFDKEHRFKTGLFSFSLGRGISLGDAYTTVPDFLGYDPASAVEQFAPGFLFYGSFMDNKVLDYDAYVAIIDNFSDSFNSVNLKNQGHLYGHRINQARGFGVINYVVAGRVKWMPIKDRCNTIYIEPYALFDCERNQKLELPADASSKIGTFGLAMDVKSGDWEFGFDVAHNIGYQDVKGLDRNIIVKEFLKNYTVNNVPFDGIPFFVNSHVTITENGQTHKAFYVPGSADQKLINQAMENTTECSHIAQESNNAVLRENQNQTLRNTVDRYRDPYTNYFNGSMAVADVAWKLYDNVKLAATVGYATGDDNPNKDINELGESQIDGDYKGFISLQEVYSGKRVRSAFMLSGRGKVPRLLSFPVNQTSADSDSAKVAPKNQYPASVSRFTNIAFIGTGLSWNFEDNLCKWAINPNIVSFWQTYAVALSGVKELTRDSCDKELSFKRDCARMHLGTEYNIYIDRYLLDGLKAFLVSGFFIAGKHFDDIKGRPLNKDQKEFLDRVDLTGDIGENTPVLGNDNAFFINMGLEYQF